MVLALLRATWVGWIFSTVGLGGIMAGVGHMTIYGLGDYVRTFETRPQPQQDPDRQHPDIEPVPGRLVL
jgi:hypothetical protein